MVKLAHVNFLEQCLALKMPVLGLGEWLEW
jgi:hypothetical protein